MFREIRRSEKIRENDKKRSEEYKKIKPEKELTISELNALVFEEIMKSSREA